MTTPLAPPPVATILAVMAPENPPSALTPQQARDRQKAYAAKRRAWARAVGRPYSRDRDARPPPGELDAAAEE